MNSLLLRVSLYISRKGKELPHKNVATKTQISIISWLIGWERLREQGSHTGTLLHSTNWRFLCVVLKPQMRPRSFEEMNMSVVRVIQVFYNLQPATSNSSFNGFNWNTAFKNNLALVCFYNHYFKTIMFNIAFKRSSAKYMIYIRFSLSHDLHCCTRSALKMEFWR